MEGLKPIRPHDVEAPRALFGDGDQAGVPEHLEMLGNGLLGDVEMCRDLADRVRFLADESQNLLPARLRQCPQNRLAVHSDPL